MIKQIINFFKGRTQKYNISVVIGSMEYKNFKVKCSKCKTKHWWSDRIITTKNSIKEWHCPKCDETKYEYYR